MIRVRQKMVFVNVFILLISVGCMNNFGPDDKGRLNEEQIIGRVPGRNPRVEEIQQILKDVGFDPGSADGIIGGQTRKVIKEFQEDKGLKPTGKIDSGTLAALHKAREELKAAARINSKDSMSSGQEVKAKVEEINLSSNTEEKITQIQTALKKAGFYKGEVDGRLGPKTRKAIRAFQKANGLKPDSVVGLKIWEDLKEYLKPEAR